MSSYLRSSKESGDTLVEVMVAISVLAIVLVGTFSLMNKGVSQMYDSMERSEVRLLLNRQIESLTYARDEYLIHDPSTPPVVDTPAYVWKQLRDNAALPAGSVSSVPALDTCTSPSSAFAVVPTGVAGSDSLKLVGMVTDTAAGFPEPTKGIWIQKIKSPSVAMGGPSIQYMDFFVRACWKPTGSAKTQVISSVVRLYDK